jgi:hypothetical protein
MEFRPDVPLIIMRNSKLTFKQKSFLLWCWICRDSDDRSDLIAYGSGCNLGSRNITWYADFLGMDRRSLNSDVFVALRNKNILKIRDDGSIKILYVDFKVFN